MKRFSSALLSICMFGCALLSSMVYAENLINTNGYLPAWNGNIPYFDNDPNKGGPAYYDPTEESGRKDRRQDSDELELAGLNGSHQRVALNNVSSAENEIKRHLDSRAADEKTAVWAAPFFRHNHTHGLGSGSNARTNSSGSAFGLDFAWGNLVLGGSFDGGRSKSTYSDRNGYSKDESDFYGISLYADWKRDQLRIYGGVGYFNEDHDMKMSNLLGRIDSSGDTNTYAASLFAEYSIEGNVVNVRPYLGVRYALVDSDSYRAAEGVICDSDKQNVVRLPVGVKFDRNFEPWGGFSIRPVMDLCLEPALGDTKVDTKLRAGGYSTSEKSRVVDGIAYSAFLGATAGWEGIGFVLGYGYQGSAHEASHGLTCGFEWHF